MPENTVVSSWDLTSKPLVKLNWYLLRPHKLQELISLPKIAAFSESWISKAAL